MLLSVGPSMIMYNLLSILQMVKLHTNFQFEYRMIDVLLIIAEEEEDVDGAEKTPTMTK